MSHTFYNLIYSEDLPDSYFAEWSHEDIELEGIKCTIDEGHQRAGRRLSDLTVILRTPKVLEFDFIWTWMSEPLINERVIKIFKENKLTGYSLRPVTIKRIKRFKGNLSTIPKFWELVITGKGGYAHPNSGIKLKDECKACGSKTYSAYEHGIIVDEKNWDGSDFFRIIEWPRILVIEKVKQIIENYKITNVELIPSQDLKWPEGVIKP
ncbi:MAG: hypothetical protein Q8O10_07705 [candidate division Zixibacteria bacterium]|nr:hypothetical protein [candidate division Zixibacteria bacterium]